MATVTSASEMRKVISLPLRSRISNLLRPSSDAAPAAKFGSPLHKTSGALAPFFLHFPRIMHKNAKLTKFLGGRGVGVVIW